MDKYDSVTIVKDAVQVQHPLQGHNSLPMYQHLLFDNK